MNILVNKMNFPQQFISAINAVRYQRSKRNLEAAVRSYDIALLAVPSHYDCLFEKGEILLQQESLPEAQEAFLLAAQVAGHSLRESRAFYKAGLAAKARLDLSFACYYETQARQKNPDRKSVV